MMFLDSCYFLQGQLIVVPTSLSKQNQTSRRKDLLTDQV